VNFIIFGIFGIFGVRFLAEKEKHIWYLTRIFAQKEIIMLK
jgi:hypothetical protein